MVKTVRGFRRTMMSRAETLGKGKSILAGEDFQIPYFTF
jgi:hypothetical protein